LYVQRMAETVIFSTNSTVSAPPSVGSSVESMVGDLPDHSLRSPHGVSATSYQSEARTSFQMESLSPSRLSGDGTVPGDHLGRMGSKSKGKGRLFHRNAEQMPFQHMLAKSSVGFGPPSPATIDLSTEGDIDYHDRHAPWSFAVRSSSASLSSRPGPRPRTPSNASSDASMPWHIPEFVSYEQQRQDIVLERNH
jgi:hypothetical protein